MVAMGVILRRLVQRLAQVLGVLAGVNLITFALFFVINTPDDMARMNLGDRRIEADAIAQWKAERGYDQPLIWNDAASGLDQWTRTLFWERSVRLFALDFGRADAADAGEIGPEVRERLGVSLQLALPILLLQVPLGLGLALLQVMFHRTRWDVWGGVLCGLMLSVSSLFYLLLGQYLGSGVWRLAPVSGFAPGLEAVRFLVLPVMLALLARLGVEVRLYRALLLEALHRDHVRTARAKGLAETRVLWRHVLRNALLPVLTHLGSSLPHLFLGALVIENFFALPGLGAYTIDAIGQQDFAVLRAMVFVGAALHIISYAVIDLVCAWADPRTGARGPLAGR